MSFVAKLRNIAKNMAMKRNSVFSVSPEKQKKYLEKLPEPRDNFERSFYQYKCQMFLMGFIHYPLNLALGILYLFKKITAKRTPVEKVEGVEALFCAENLSEDILPTELYERYPSLIKIDHTVNFSLSEEDKKFLKLVGRKYPFRWHFRFKLMLKIGMYRYVIDKYDPKALIVSSEYSFTSSLITEYLEKQGIKHINVMHGEKLYNIRDSFVNFTEYYLWDKHYVNLLGKLRGNTSCMKVALPPVLRLKDEFKREKEMDLTFYLAGETEEEVKKVLESLLPLVKKGKKICIRSHPLYTRVDRAVAEEMGFTVEEKEDISFEASLMRTNCAAALYSTVLFQAYCNGIPFAIDDVNRPDFYEKLKSLDYVGFSLEHKLLSEIIKSES